MRKPVPQKLRFIVLQRDQHTCQYCGAKAPNVRLQLDHVVPVAEGGENTLENLKTSCWDCNIGKGVMPFDDRDKYEAMLQDIMDLDTCIICCKPLSPKPENIGDFMINLINTRVEGFGIAFCYGCVWERMNKAHQALVDRINEKESSQEEA